ncbi:MAG: excinuclease ABC subunit UvrC [Alphaproteobacteria bacterium]
MTALEEGIKIIQSYAKNLQEKPGVYRMLGDKNQVLYVGKAKNLKNRVTSYTRPDKLSIRIQRMISLTQKMEFVVTHTEGEALLLEVNLIKNLKPRFNVLFSDDKSFPYLVLTKGELPAQIMIYRGAKKIPGDYFGPFASKHYVQKTLEIMTKVFRIRTCSDRMFRSRQRPCLQYHIKRCTAPCVGKISWEDYAKSVEKTKKFLQGHNQELQADLAKEMAKASHNLDFERAALLRDQIQALTKIQEEQGLFVRGIDDADVVALVQEGGKTAVQVFFFRHESNYGNRVYFPQQTPDQEVGDILSAFLSWFYVGNKAPKQILLNHEISDRAILEDALSSQAGYRVHIAAPKRGDLKQLIGQVETNARESLALKLSHEDQGKKLHKKLQEVLGLNHLPNRLEIYDNSHLQGTNAYGVMVVANTEGFDRKSYRKFAIKDMDPDARGGDDYAMMRQVLWRRFHKAETETLPDLVILDGGKGQLSMGLQVMADLDLTVPIIGIAKGEDRNAGREKVYMKGKDPIILDPTDPLLYYLQRLRDESHRFAIGTHRYKRQKVSLSSGLDQIKGLGPKRKKQLLNYFGSVKAVSESGLQDLQKVEGISGKIAETIYDYFHG